MVSAAPNCTLVVSALPFCLWLITTVQARDEALAAAEAALASLAAVQVRVRARATASIRAAVRVRVHVHSMPVTL